MRFVKNAPNAQKKHTQIPYKVGYWYYDTFEKRIMQVIGFDICNYEKCKYKKGCQGICQYEDKRDSGCRYSDYDNLLKFESKTREEVEQKLVLERL